MLRFKRLQEIFAIAQPTQVCCWLYWSSAGWQSAAPLHACINDMPGQSLLRRRRIQVGQNCVVAHRLMNACRAHIVTV